MSRCMGQNLGSAFRPRYDMSRHKRETLRVDEPQLDQKSAKIKIDEETCLDEAARQVNERSPPQPQVWLVAAIDAGVLALLWLLAWMIVAVGAGWRRGFGSRRDVALCTRSALRSTQ
jgi:hypothetical protein